MNPRDLGSYLGWFMWTRYCKQQNLDRFVQFLKCVAEIRPPTYIQKLPKATKKSYQVQNPTNSDDDLVDI